MTMSRSVHAVVAGAGRLRVAGLLRKSLPSAVKQYNIIEQCASILLLSDTDFLCHFGGHNSSQRFQLKGCFGSFTESAYSTKKPLIDSWDFFVM